jgi:hypothetical protein
MALDSNTESRGLKAKLTELRELLPVSKEQRKIRDSQIFYANWQLIMLALDEFILKYNKRILEESDISIFHTKTRNYIADLENYSGKQIELKTAFNQFLPLWKQIQDCVTETSTGDDTDRFKRVATMMDLRTRLFSRIPTEFRIA